MRKPTFSLAETNLMVLYNPGTRQGLMEELQNMLHSLGGDEIELRTLTLSTLRKLEGLSDLAFATLDLTINETGW